MPTESKPKMRYPGPLKLDQARSKFAINRLATATFDREGLRATDEYRDLGVAAATNGAVKVKHVRRIQPFTAETGWHWHDLDVHVVYILKGWLEFRFDGMADKVRVSAGDCLSQPGGVAHNVVGASDDLEVLEINLPADYGTEAISRTT